MQIINVKSNFNRKCESLKAENKVNRRPPTLSNKNSSKKFFDYEQPEPVKYSKKSYGTRNSSENKALDPEQLKRIVIF